MRALIQAGRYGLLLVCMLFMTACDHSEHTHNSPVVAIVVAPQVSQTQGSSSPRLALGSRVQYEATVYYLDGSHQVMTDGPVWRSTTDMAIVSQSGVVTTKRLGQVAIEASFEGAQGISSEVTVTAAVVTAIQLTPATVSLAKGNSQTLTATATYSDQTSADISSQVAWIAADTNIATVTPVGLLAGVGVGSTTVTASFNGISSNKADVTVTDAVVTAIQLTPATVSLAKGNSQTLTAMATYSDQTSADISSQVAWVAADTNIATVTPSGVLAGVGVGSTTLSASLNGISSNSASVTVTDAVVTAIQLTPATVSMAKGNYQTLTATATYSDQTSVDVTSAVAWSSADTTIATVAPAGVVAGVGVGATTIRASFNGISSNSASVTVTDAVVTAIQLTPATPSLPKGTSQALTATATYSDQTSVDVTSSVAWVAADTSIATVTPAGVVAGVGVGATTIRASFNGITSNSVSVTVTDAVVTAIQVTPATVSMAKGYSQSLTATATYSDQTSADVSSAVAWVAADTSIVTVTPAGVVAGVGVGDTTIRASFNGITSNSVAVTVTDAVVTAIQLTPATVSMAKGYSQSLTATATYSDQTSADISSQVAWSSADTTIATVTPAGVAAGVGVGSTTVSASLNGISSNTASVTVTDAVVTAIQLTPATVSMAKGYSQALTASAIYSDQTSVDVTSSVAWSSADTTIATVTPAGVVAGVGVGSTTVSASFNGISSNAASVTVTDAVVTAIQMTLPSPSILKGASQSLIATATYSDQSSVDVTRSVAWSVADTDIATVTADGLLAGVRVGNTTLSASLNGISSAPTKLSVYAVGKVVTWGCPDWGGDSASVQSQLNNVKAIYRSGTAFAAVKTDGSVVTWGDVSHGGDSSTVQAQLTNVKTIVGNSGAFAALRGDGSVVTWGLPSYGGDSSAVQSQLTQVRELFFTSYSFAALRTDGTVVTWGDAAHGGDSSSVQSQLTDVQTIYHSVHAYAALKGDGTVVTWGRPDVGGDSSSVQDELTHVTRVFETGASFAALKSDGTLVNWGAAEYGGDSSSVQDQLTQVQAVTSSGFAAAALKTDGSVVTWGKPAYGGDSSMVQGQLNHIKRVLAGTFAFAAIKEDGSVVTWGEAGSGGDSSAVQSQLTQVQTVLASYRALAALKQDGSVVTWGSAIEGGDSSAVQSQLTGVDTLFSTMDAFAALKRDGTVVTWGNPTDGGNSSAVQADLVQVQHIVRSSCAFAALVSAP